MDNMREITGELVVCIECGKLYEQPEGGSTEMPCGAHLSTHYPPAQWVPCIEVADALALAAPHCKGQDCASCRKIGRMSEQRSRHMPVQA